MKKTCIMALTLIMVIMALAACAKPAQKPDSALESSALAPAVIKIAGSTSVGPVIEALAEKYTQKNSHVTFNIEQTGSGTGVTSVGEGTCDMGMASRDLKDVEKTTYPNMKATVLCFDGVAIVVNPKSGVDELTAAQVNDIFEGKIKNWSELGGKNANITLYSRDASSGTREAFQTLFLKEELDETRCLIVDSNGAMGTAVEGDATGIGYMSLGVAPQYKVTMLKIDGVEASVDNLKDGTYTFFRNFNLLTLGDAAGEAAAFINFCLTDQAAIAYMEEKGFVVAVK